MKRTTSKKNINKKNKKIDCDWNKFLKMSKILNLDIKCNRINLLCLPDIHIQQICISILFSCIDSVR